MSQAASREWMENMCTAELPQFECDEIEFSDEFTSRKELQHQVLADNKNWAVGWMMCHIIFLSGIARPSIFIYFFFFIIFFSSPHYNLKTHRLFVSNTQLTVFFFVIRLILTSLKALRLRRRRLSVRKMAPATTLTMPIASLSWSHSFHFIYFSRFSFLFRNCVSLFSLRTSFPTLGNFQLLFFCFGSHALG